TPSTTDASIGVGFMGAMNADFYTRTTTSNLSATTQCTAACTYCTFSSSIFPSNGLTFTFNPNPQYYNYNIVGSANAFPFGVAAGKRAQWLVRACEFNQPAGASQGDIEGVSFVMRSTATTTFTTITLPLCTVTMSS